MGCTENVPDETVTVRLTRNPVDIVLGGEEHWSSLVPFGKLKKFIFIKDETESFDFQAITFWGRSNDQIDSTQVARTFEKNINGNSTSFRDVTIDSIDVQNKDQVSFSVCNNTTVGNGSIGLEFTILDKQGPDGQILYTSLNPHIDTPNQGGN